MEHKFKKYNIENINKEIKNNFEEYELIVKKQNDYILYEKGFKDSIQKRMIFKDHEKDKDFLGIFPIIIKNIGQLDVNHIFIKFKKEIILPSKSHLSFYSTIPIDIGVYIYQNLKENLIDYLSLGKVKFTLYGKPEKGIICRYKESEINEERIIKKYEEALVKIEIKNNLDEMTSVNKIVFPLEDIVVDSENDKCFVPGTIEMTINSLFGKNIALVHLQRVKGKKHFAMNTNANKFTMEWGY